jgi:rhamnulokinase
MHHAIPPTFVVHTHSTVMNQLTCCVKGEALARELYGTAILWIPFVDPGFILSREISAQMQAYAQAHDGALPRAILMQNHGIILAGESIEAIQAETQALLAPLVARMAELPPTAEAPEARGAEPIVGEIEATLLALAAEAGGTPHVRFNESAPVRRFVGDAEGSSLAAQGPLTPDQIVYCKSFPLWIDPAAGDLRAAWAAHIEQYGYAPKVVLAKGLGLFAVGDSERASGIVSRVYADAIKIMLGARRLGGVRFMTPRDREFIDNWEVEAYRRNVSAKQMS